MNAERKKNILYVLAHQDDEFGAWPFIYQNDKAGHNQTIIYLTDSNDEGIAEKRQKETNAFFVVTCERKYEIYLTGYENNLPVGRLYQNLQKSYELLKAFYLSNGPFDLVVTHALEGGHQDHDCCALLMALLVEAKIHAGPVLAFAMYNIYRRKFPFIRGASPLEHIGKIDYLEKPLTYREWFRYLFSCRFFGSQKKVMLLLVPSMFLSFIYYRGFRFQILSLEKIWERPHSGPLMYETRGREPYGKTNYIDISVAINSLRESIIAGYL